MPMQDRLKVFLITVLAIFVLICLKVVQANMNGNTWVCQKGKWVMQGHPTSAKPTTPCR